MITTIKISVEYAQIEMRRQSKHVTTKYQLNTKEGSNGGYEGDKSYKTYRKQIIK